MELQQLQYFRTVAYHEHVTRAAEELNISQPALSSMIARLESELGVPLFDRTGRSIVLNHNGKQFLERVNQILMDIDYAKEELHDLNGKHENFLRLAVSTSQFLLEIPSFLQTHPDFRWQQQIVDSETAARMLRFHQVDLAVTSPGIRGDEFVSTLLLKENFMLAVSRKHPLAEKKRVRLSDVMDECFILLPSGWTFREQTNILFESIGAYPENIIECDHMMRRVLIQKNVGVSIASQKSLRRNLYDKNVRLIPLEDISQTREIVLTRAKGHYQNTAMRQFTDFMVGIFQGI